MFEIIITKLLYLIYYQLTILYPQLLNVCYNKNQKFMKQNIIIVILSFLFTNIYGQKNELGYKTESHKIYSSDNDEYLLKVTFPRNYDPNKEYKTLYYLDAYWLTEIVLGSYTILDLCDYVENIVFVGVSLHGSEKDWNTQRNMDFTPTSFQNLGLLDKLKEKDEKNKMKITITSGAGNLFNKNSTGGANLFLDFLENDIINFIENKYPNLNKRKGLLGHSLGGLFGFYTLKNRPELFQDLLLISASLSWNSSEIVSEEFFSKLLKSKTDIKLYHSYGTDEVKATVKSNNTLSEMITQKEIKNFNYNFSPIKKANHHSVLSRAIYDGLLYLYRK